MDKGYMVTLPTGNMSNHGGVGFYSCSGLSAISCTDTTTVAYSSAAAQNNLIIVGYCRASLAALAGATAGILGLTGFLAVRSPILEDRQGLLAFKSCVYAEYFGRGPNHLGEVSMDCLRN
ncbi:ER membrane complex subunit 6 [Sparganum proliferum]